MVQNNPLQGRGRGGRDLNDHSVMQNGRDEKGCKMDVDQIEKSRKVDVDQRKEQ